MWGKRPATMPCKRTKGVTPEVNLGEHISFTWLWNSEDMSPEVQNRGISSPKNAHVSTKFFLKKVIGFIVQKFQQNILPISDGNCLVWTMLKWNRVKFDSKLFVEYLKLVGYKFLDEVSPPSDVKHKLENYFKFLVVRDPWTLLLSAYRDNFENNDSALQDSLHQSYGRIIVERYRKYGSKLKFVDFLQLFSTSILTIQVRYNFVFLWTNQSFL